MCSEHLREIKFWEKRIPSEFIWRPFWLVGYSHLFYVRAQFNLPHSTRSLASALWQDLHTLAQGDYTYTLTSSLFYFLFAQLTLENNSKMTKNAGEMSNHVRYDKIPAVHIFHAFYMPWFILIVAIYFWMVGWILFKNLVYPQVAN